MSPQLLHEMLREMARELVAAEREIASSADCWAVREADSERRLARLSQRLRPAVSTVAPRDAVALYSTRWSHQARRSVAMAK